MGALESGIGVAGGLLGTGLGLLMRDSNDKRQLKQQEKLQNLQIKGQKEMGLFNQGMALDQWNKTNFEAQRKHMENAGLNVGLMYSGSGGGGATSAVPTGSVSSGQAPVGGGEAAMGMEKGMAAAMNLAQMENIKANTRKTNIEADKAAGVDTNKTIADTGKAIAETDLTKVQTSNAQIQGNIMKLDEKLKQVELDINDYTAPAKMAEGWEQLRILEAQAKQEVAKGHVAEETAWEALKQARQTTAEQQLRMASIKAGTEKTMVDSAVGRAQIKQIAAAIDNLTIQQSLGMNEQNLEQQRIDIQKKLQEWETSGFKQGVEIGRDLMKKLGESNPAGGMRKK